MKPPVQAQLDFAQVSGIQSAKLKCPAFAFASLLPLPQHEQEDTTMCLAAVPMHYLLSNEKATISYPFRRASKASEAHKAKIFQGRQITERLLQRPCPNSFQQMS